MDDLKPEEFAEMVAECVTHALHRDQVLQEVCVERLYQDGKFGGPSNDDRLISQEWFNILGRLVADYHRGRRDFRPTMIKIAATAVAAVESFDRGNSPHG